jgi:hypothetical protein
MIYEDYGDRKLIDPDVMGPPAVWLASNDSDGFNGRRILAKGWDGSIDPKIAAEGAAIGPAFNMASGDGGTQR